jgi:hypothetical protein
MVSPAEGATVDPVRNGFQFSAQTHARISTCEFLVDNKTVKEAAYNDVIVGRTLKYLITIPDGTHTWQVICESEEGRLESPIRTMVVKNAEETGVTVKGSGIMRGSLEHTLTLAQNPIVVRKVAQGDVVTVNIVVAPSKLKRQLYLRGIQTRNGTKILWMEDLRTGRPVPMYFTQGVDYTLNISTAKFQLQFVEYVSGKAVIRLSPAIGSEANGQAQSGQEGAQGTAGTQGMTTPEVPSLEGLPPLDEGETGTATDSGTETQPEPVVGAEGTEGTVAEDTAVQTPPTSSVDEERTPQAPKPGVFKRMLGWLSSIFG